MAKKRKRRASNRSNSGFEAKGMKGILLNGALICGGLAAANYVAKKIQKKDVSGEDLLGLDGDASKFATPAILAAAGLAGMTMVKSPYVKKLAVGVLVAGMSGVVNAAAGKSVVALGDAEEEGAGDQIMLPGVGDPQIPEVVTYDDLPDNQEMLTTYHEDMGDADTVYVDEYGNPIEGAEDDEDLLGIEGDDDEDGQDLL